MLQDVLQMDSNSKRGPPRAKRDHNALVNQSSVHLVGPQRCHLLREAPVAVVVCTKSVPHHRHMRRQVLPCSACKEGSQGEGLVGRAWLPSAALLTIPLSIKGWQHSTPHPGSCDITAAARKTLGLPGVCA